MAMTSPSTTATTTTTSLLLAPTTLETTAFSSALLERRKNKKNLPLLNLTCTTKKDHTSTTKTSASVYYQDGQRKDGDAQNGSDQIIFSALTSDSRCNLSPTQTRNIKYDSSHLHQLHQQLQQQQQQQQQEHQQQQTFLNSYINDDELKNVIHNGGSGNINYNNSNRFSNTPSTTTFPIKVLHGLYLGNLQTSADLNTLQKLNISYIVNVTSDLPNEFENREEFKYLRIPITDCNWSQDMDLHFVNAIKFIEEGLQNQRNVLVHCIMGMSRSVAITLAYLMKSQRFQLDEAYDFLRGFKSNINPNLGLMEQLQRFGSKLDGMNEDSTAASTTTDLSTAAAATTTTQTSHHMTTTSYHHHCHINNNYNNDNSGNINNHSCNNGYINYYNDDDINNYRCNKHIATTLGSETTTATAPATTTVTTAAASLDSIITPLTSSNSCCSNDFQNIEQQHQQQQQQPQIVFNFTYTPPSTPLHQLHL
ncbi:hypothetical protein HELRODRAFT_191497 [Helobdella robusta]|uniref:protein-tyrosine-phosphatase n=1 Tax=Helobdella robusta TaxID=6412 RepID=T1FT15_HELRO|nr:hypothetical protein HELRODRAFT_191497 [Helobdella robusta]ESO04884.1 hypothetical protein HELRODRAFT_191497 [Helobdella robusta]